jgi:predicted nucleotidyltransferase
MRGKGWVCLLGKSWNHQTAVNWNLSKRGLHFPLYKEYKNIILKTLGFENKLKKIIRDIPDVEKAWIYGSYAQEKMAIHSDIDLLIVGQHDIIQLQNKISALQKEIGREVNMLNMGPEEFRRRRRQKDPFIQNVLKAKYIEIKI